MHPAASKISLLSAVVLSGALCSAPALDWREYSTGQSKALYGVTYGNGRYLAVGSGGAVVQSQDGASWLQLTSFTDLNLRGVAFGANAFVAISGFGNGDIWRSADGSSWTKITSPASTVFSRPEGLPALRRGRLRQTATARQSRAHPVIAVRPGRSAWTKPLQGTF